MVKTAASLPRGVSEADEAGVALAPSRKVSPPRVKDARVAFECALDRVVTVGQGAHAGNLVLGKILLVHVRDGIVEEGKGIDPLRFDAIGRLGGARFCRMQDIFEL
jgi:flavin reductase (DIM6/NTAB) family NADH-FMN oxidoreductase RutF